MYRSCAHPGLALHPGRSLGSGVWAAWTLLLVASLLPGCTTAREYRQSITAAPVDWETELKEDSLEALLEDIRCLAELGPDRPDALVSMLVLARQARPRGNPSMLVRADCLKAAWELAANTQAEPLRVDEMTPSEFSERTRRFEQLVLDPSVASDDQELVELALFMGAYRFPPGDEDLALDLADLVVTRGAWQKQGPVQAAFAEGASGCARHALVLLTLRLADDPHALVREEALRGARYMQPGPGLDLVAGALGIESHRNVLLMALDSLESMVGKVDTDELRHVLELVPIGADLTVRRRAASVAETLGTP